MDEWRRSLKLSGEYHISNIPQKGAKKAPSALKLKLQYEFTSVTFWPSALSDQRTCGEPTSSHHRALIGLSRSQPAVRPACTDEESKLDSFEASESASLTCEGDYLGLGRSERRPTPRPKET